MALNSDMLRYKLHNMTKKPVQALLEDIRVVSEQNYEIVKAIRALVKRLLKVRRKKSSTAELCSPRVFSLVVSSPTRRT